MPERVAAAGAIVLFSACSALTVQAAAPVSFTEHVAPILAARCTTCHRAGGPAPFSLTTYADARRHATQIVAATKRRYMPPWKPEPQALHFVGERRLSDDEIRVLEEWARGGTREGRPSDLPASADESDGWQLGRPDLIVTLPGYALRPDGADVFRNFVVSTQGTRTRYVRGLEFRPGNRAVHHANIRIDPTPASRELADASRRSPAGAADADPSAGYEGTILRSADYPDGHFLGWTPGQAPPLAPPGLAWRLEAGSDLVVQLHLRPTGKTEDIRPSIALYFTDIPPTRVPTMVRLGKQDLRIPPGASSFPIADKYVLPVDAEVHAIQPHAHYRARDVRVSAVEPDGHRVALLHIAQWDFNWQDQYRYAAPFWLPAGTTIEMAYTFDNSEANARNPDRPPRHVEWGWRSSDEMADVWIQLMTRTDADRARLAGDARVKMATEDTIGCETLIAREPEYAALRNDAAALYMELGQPLRALTHFSAVSRLQPRSARARYNVAVALEALGRTSEAATEYDAAVRLDSRYSLAHNNLGSLLFSAGRLADARAHFERAVETGPANAEAHNNLGAVLLASGDASAALPHLERAVALRSIYAEAYFNMARALAAEGRLADAIRAATTASDQAKAAGKTALLAEIAKQTQLYRSGLKR